MQTITVSIMQKVGLYKKKAIDQTLAIYKPSWKHHLNHHGQKQPATSNGNCLELNTVAWDSTAKNWGTQKRSHSCGCNQPGMINYFLKDYFLSEFKYRSPNGKLFQNLTSEVPLTERALVMQFIDSLSHLINWWWPQHYILSSLLLACFIFGIHKL